MNGVLLSGGNPQIAKAEGDAAVQAYIAAMPGWKRDVGKRLDAVIARSVRKVQKAIKWNSPFYGIEGKGWFLSFHVFTQYVKVTFFKGTLLRPIPPGERHQHHHLPLWQRQPSPWQFRQLRCRHCLKNRRDSALAHQGPGALARAEGTSMLVVQAV
jgi:hypothetical protein